MQELPNKISLAETGGRLLTKKVFDHVFPYRAEDSVHGLKRARELIENQGFNLFVFTTHPSETDEPREYGHMWESNEFLRRRIHVPTAWDQNTPLVRAAAKLTGVTLYPVVTKDAAGRDACAGHNAGDGNLGYFRGIKDAMSHPGDPAIVFLAPDAGRRPLLQTPDTRAAEFLMTASNERFAVLFVGVEIDGVQDYAKFGGKNPLRPYTLHFGECLTDSEVLMEIKQYRDENELFLPVRAVKQHGEEKYTVYERYDRPFYGAEQWMYATQFPALVPEEYKN